VRTLTFKLPDGRLFPLEVDLTNDEYWWTEGNGGCDCNRIVMLGKSYPELKLDDFCDYPACGETIKLIDVKPEWEKEL
jgi:hypothetical protein